MKRIILVAGLLGLAAVLSACDKCGNFTPLFGSSGTQSCGGKTTG